MQSIFYVDIPNNYIHITLAYPRPAYAHLALIHWYFICSVPLSLFFWSGHPLSPGRPGSRWGGCVEAQWAAVTWIPFITAKPGPASAAHIPADYH